MSSEGVGQEPCEDCLNESPSSSLVDVPDVKTCASSVRNHLDLEIAEKNPWVSRRDAGECGDAELFEANGRSGG